jgi:lipopolysaccharide export system permease protein
VIKHFDRYIFLRLFTITVFVLLIFIFIFIMIDFSENSDDFTDRGATLKEIWTQYYVPYIPEMIRLVIPVAIFSACLFLTGQLSERLEITAFKAAGISLYRLILPYFAFALVAAGTISFLDSYTIPKSNKKRITFENQYLKQKNERIDRSDIYRELSPNSILEVNYFDENQLTAYRVRFVEYDSLTIKKTLLATSMSWNREKDHWVLTSVTERTYSDSGYVQTRFSGKDTTLSILPQDLARSTSDIYQLSYREAVDYIVSIKRSGAGGVNIPTVQYYGRLAYPLSIIVVILIGFAVASVRRRGGKGIYLAVGLTISFLYLAFMKIAEPFGYYGTISPAMAAALPHISFFLVGLILLINTKK